MAITETSGPAVTLVDANEKRVPWPEAWAVLICLSAVTATAGTILRPSAVGLFVPAVCLGVTILAAGFDAASGRIPNPLTYPAVLVGIGVNCISLLILRLSPGMAGHWLGAAGPSQAVLGLLIFGGIGLVGVIFAGMGGGDMKLLAAIGALMGATRATEGLLCGAVLAVVYAVVNLLIVGRLDSVFREVASRFLTLVYLREWTPPDPTEQKPSLRRTIPLAIPLLAGMVLSRVPVIAGAIGWLIRP